MNHTTKITVLAICAFSLTVFLTVYGGSISGGTTGNTFNSIYESDRDNDGVIDAVYYYTYDIAGNEIKVEIDSDNDGVINKVYCYNMETVPFRYYKKAPISNSSSAAPFESKNK